MSYRCYFLYLFMIFFQHCFHSEQPCFPVLRTLQTDWVHSNPQSSLFIQNSCSIEYPCILSRAIQSEWIFLQHVTLYTGGVLVGVEKIIRETFLPRLFLGKTKTLPPIIRDLSKMPVKISRLRLLNPVTSAQEKYLSSQWGNTELVWSMMVGGGHSPMPTTNGK